MKLLLTLFSTLILTDITINGSLPAHSNRFEQLSLNEGKTDIEVAAVSGKEDISCVFARAYTGEELVRQEHTTRCHVVVNSPELPTYIAVQVFNNEGHAVSYVIHAATILPLK